MGGFFVFLLIFVTPRRVLSCLPSLLHRRYYFQRRSSGGLGHGASVRQASVSDLQVKRARTERMADTSPSKRGKPASQEIKGSLDIVDDEETPRKRSRPSQEAEEGKLRLSESPPKAAGAASPIDLPDTLSGVVALLFEAGPELAYLKRHIVALDGDLTSEVLDATHVITALAKQSDALKELVERNPKVKVVGPAWVRECVAQGKLAATDSFEIPAA